MKDCKREWAVCLLFGLALLALCAGTLFSARDYSAREKRYLAAAPTLSAEELLSGRFAAGTEAYMADHLPCRDALVGAAAYGELLSGRLNTGEILRGASGRHYERPVRWDEETAEENLAAIRAFAEKTGLRTSLMLVPSAGFVLRDDLPRLHERYTDDEMIARCRALAGEEIAFIDLTGPFGTAENRAGLYYATDHHWTSRGARAAAGAYLKSVGRTITPAEGYAVESVPGFRGSTYARSALWLTPREELELWDCGGSFAVTNSESDGTHEGLFYRERLGSDDPYTVFLDGNHALVRIENRDPDAEGSLLVIRDSFSNCLGCFLAEGYRTVVLADLRYYRLPLSELCAQEDFDALLVVYSLGNFLREANLLWLE